MCYDKLTTFLSESREKLENHKLFTVQFNNLVISLNTARNTRNNFRVHCFLNMIVNR